MRKWFEGNSGWMVGSGVAGIALIIAGVIANNTLSQVIGGALFGAALGGFISLIDAEKRWDLVLDLLKETINSEFRCGERKIEKYRKVWYLYYVTKMNEKYIWRLHVLDFSLPVALGELRTSLKILGPTNDEHIYSYVAAFRDCRLVMFANESGSDEPCAVHIFPYMGESYQAVHFGIVILRTWDMTNSISPCILAQAPLSNRKDSGVIDDRSLIEALNQLWQERFGQLNDIFKLPLL